MDAALDDLLAAVGVTVGPAERPLVMSAGTRLEDVEEASVDAVVARDALRGLPVQGQLALIGELGRVLRPGGWAVFALSTDPSGGSAPVEEPSRRDLLRSLARRPAPAPPAAFVPLDALGATAVQAGLTLERIEGAGTRETVVLARR